MTRGGNWEDRTVLRRVTPRGSPEEEAEPRRLAREALRACARRVRSPGRDDKVLADWNGLTIAALARASAVFDEPGWLADRARRVRLHHDEAARRRTDGCYTPGARAIPAPARCSMITPRWPARRLAYSRRAASPPTSKSARKLASEAIDLFGDGAGGFFLTASDAADVPGARPRQAHDGATPSGIGLLAETFVRLWHLTDEARWGEAAEGLIRSVSGAPEGLGGCPLTLMSADMLARGGSVVVDGPLDDPAAQALAFAALRAPDPSLTVLRLDRRRWPNGSPRDDLPRVDGPIAMLCQGQTCSLPVTAPEALDALDERAEGLRLKARGRKRRRFVACAKATSPHHFGHGHVLASHDHRDTSDETVVRCAVARMRSGGVAAWASDIVFDRFGAELDMAGRTRDERIVAALNWGRDRSRGPSAGKADAVRGIDRIALEMRQFEPGYHFIGSVL